MLTIGLRDHHIKSCDARYLRLRVASQVKSSEWDAIVAATSTEPP